MPIEFYQMKLSIGTESNTIQIFGQFNDYCLKYYCFTKEKEKKFFIIFYRCFL
jgi:hypothetical protein